MNSSADYKIGLFNLGCGCAAARLDDIAAHAAACGLTPTYDLSDSPALIMTACGCSAADFGTLISTLIQATELSPHVVLTGLQTDIANVVLTDLPQIICIPDHARADAVLQALFPEQAASREPGKNASRTILPVRTSNTPYAHLSLSDGADTCLLPRSDLQPRPKSATEIVNAARHLVDQGVQELVLTDVGQNLFTPSELHDVLKQLSDTGAWIRLHAIPPQQSVQPFLPLMADGLILPYLDLSLLHASPPMLDLFNNPFSADDMLRDLDTWRTACPGLEIRGTFHVGHPQETEQDFRSLLAWLDTARLGRISSRCFDGLSTDGQYRPPSEHMRERAQALLTHQQSISTPQLQQKIGRILTVLVDDVDDQGAIARSYADGPLIDGCVFMNDETGLAVGDMVEVEIDHADEYDLWGHLYD